LSSPPFFFYFFFLRRVPVLTTAAVTVNRVRGQTASGGVRAREHRYVEVDVDSDGRGRPANWWRGPAATRWASAS
jgi:hypothetical protein